MKKRDLLKELRGLSAEELLVKATEMAEESMKLRFRNAAGQFDNTHRFNELRRGIARAKTLITEKAAKAS